MCWSITLIIVFPPSPLSAGRGLSLQTNFQRGGFDKTSTFRRELLGKRGGLFSRGGGGSCNFHIKINENLKYLMTNKVYKQNHFSLSYLRLQTGRFYLRIWLLLKYNMVLRMKNFNISWVH